MVRLPNNGKRTLPDIIHRIHRIFMETNVVGKTRELVDRWITAKKRFEAARRALVSADVELANSQNALGGWLVPKDQGNKVPFNIWFGSGIIEATRQSNTLNDYSVRWRKEPEGEQLSEMGS